MNESFSGIQNSIIQKKRQLLKKILLPEAPFLRYSQYNKILEQIGDKVSEFSINMNENEEDFENRLYDAVEVVNDIRVAFEEETEDKNSEEKQIRKEDHVIWLHGDVQRAFSQGFESEHSREVDKDWLTTQAIKYLQRPWMENELFEWIIVDALMFKEVSAFGEFIKKNLPKESASLNKAYYLAKGNIEKMEKAILKEYFENWRYKFLGFFLFPLLITFFSYYKFSKDWAMIGAATYLSLLIIFFFIRGAFRLLTKKAKDQKKMIKSSIGLYSTMAEVYEILKDGTISPKYLREKLYETSKIGAVWPSAIFMIVDYAVKRNPAIWNAPASWAYEKH